MRESPYRRGPVQPEAEAPEIEWQVTLFLFILSWPLGAIGTCTAFATVALVAPAAGELLLHVLGPGAPGWLFAAAVFAAFVALTSIRSSMSDRRVH